MSLCSLLRSKKPLLEYIQNTPRHRNSCCLRCVFALTAIFPPWVCPKCVHLNAMSGQSTSALYTARRPTVALSISTFLSAFKYSKGITTYVMSGFLPLVSQKYKESRYVCFSEKKPHLRIYFKVSWSL